jgi:Restriction alleviation protein Lar
MSKYHLDFTQDLDTALAGFDCPRCHKHYDPPVTTYICPESYEEICTACAEAAYPDDNSDTAILDHKLGTVLRFGLHELPRARRVWLARYLRDHLEPEEYKELASYWGMSADWPRRRPATKLALKPCPWCSGPASIRDAGLGDAGFTVGCAHDYNGPDMCGMTPRSLPYLTAEAAADAWNARKR